MSQNQILFGLALVLVLAVGSQLLARLLRVPGIVVLLPAGFLAGVATDDVHPQALLGSLYQPFVAIAVGVILFEAGLRLSFEEIVPAVRRAVLLLITVGALLTWLAVTATVALLFGDMDTGAAFLVGAILVVSGPTVVLPLLAFIRPSRNVRSLLKWEGTLVDPIGALLGVLVFVGVKSGKGWQPGEMLVHLGVGALVAAVAAPVFWFLLREAHRNAPRLVVSVTLMVVVGAVAAADLISDDAGLVAAVLLGIAVANQRRLGVSLALYEFEEALVQLLVGVLFVLVATSVSPDELRFVLPEALVLVAVMILVIRPAVVALCTLGSSFTRGERAFAGWMAPRGIVAGATASAFGPALAEKGVAGAGKILPIVFVAILGTVVVYGLSAAPVARRLGVAGLAWARELGTALRESGVAVRMWVGSREHQAAARRAGLDADRGRIMVDAISREAELEEVTDALLLTQSDDFNTLGAAELRDELGNRHVFRLAPRPDQPDLLPPAREPGILGDRSLTFTELDRRFAAGARIVTRSARDGAEADVPLIAVGPAGRLSIAADGRPPDAQADDTVIALARRDRATG
jgi:NhaP-type Na+/H+ or K+/H+ antiporter